MEFKMEKEVIVKEREFKKELEGISEHHQEEGCFGQDQASLGRLRKREDGDRGGGEVFSPHRGNEEKIEAGKIQPVRL